MRPILVTIGVLVAIVAMPVAAGAKTRGHKRAKAHAKLPFLAGAATEDTTPPAPNTQADSQFGPNNATCPRSVYPARGRFGLQDPFRDSNGNLQWDEQPPEPFCDANGNGRWDGIYSDNGKGPAIGVHDPLDVRAFAVSDGRHKPVVYASATQIGIFDFYTEQVRAQLRNTYKVDADLVVSANHNESSPDSIGLYGAYSGAAGIGLRSGIDEYFMRFLEDRIAHAAADAVHNLRPARLYAIQVQRKLAHNASGSEYPLLSGLSQRLSDQFPTTAALKNDNRIAAIDPKLGVLQARGKNNRPVFTVASLAAHNQEMGNSSAQLSGDWPVAFEHAFDRAHTGTAIFLVGDNGSEEDPQTSPPAISKGSENHTSAATQFIQAQATGGRLASIVAKVAKAAQQLRRGAVTLSRKQICVPLENNGFVALAAAGEFGLRQAYVCDGQGNPSRPLPNGSIVPTAGAQFRTFIGYSSLGPDLQLIDIPGEAFPALMLGSPFGSSEESCNRANPAVPAWHANSPYRFQVGLADDLTGYLIPAWGFASGTPGLFNNDFCSSDQNGHRHKLESESVGPTGANDIANGLARMLDSQPDRSARIVHGRFVLPDGGLSRWPTGAVAALIASPGSATLDKDHGTLIGAPGTAGAGARAVDETGVFMDYDGQPQRAPDITTRGMMVLGPGGCVRQRLYLNVFDNLAQRGKLGRRRPEQRVTPPKACKQPQLQPLAAAGTGLALTKGDARLARAAGPFAVRSKRRSCKGRLRRPRLILPRIQKRGHKRGQQARSLLQGSASAGRCGRRRARIARVAARLDGDPTLLLARGRAHWRLTLPAGVRHVTVEVVDTDGLTTRAKTR